MGFVTLSILTTYMEHVPASSYKARVFPCYIVFCFYVLILIPVDQLLTVGRSIFFFFFFFFFFLFSGFFFAPRGRVGVLASPYTVKRVTSPTSCVFYSNERDSGLTKKKKKTKIISKYETSFDR